MHIARFSTLNRVAIFFLVVALSLVLLGYLVVTDRVCVTRTGVEPDPRYFTEAPFFRDAIHATRTLVADALVRQFDVESGFFVYAGHPRGATSGENNDIRQLLGSRILAQESTTDSALLPLHEKNLDSIFREWYREEGDIGYVYVDDKSKLGANATLLRVLVSSPLFGTYEHEAQKLVSSIYSLSNSDGSFQAWFKEPSYTYDDAYLLTFYSGEAILALLEYSEKTGDQRAYEVAVRAQNFYITEYADNIAANYYPAYVPWHTLTLARLYEKTGNETYAHAIFVMNDRLLELQDRTNFVGRFYNPKTPEYGTPHGSSDAVYTEGIAVAYGVAKSIGDTLHRDAYLHALVLAFHNLQQLQFRPSSYRLLDDGETAERLSGGVMTSACNRTVRIDTMAHSVDALDALLRVLE